MNTSIKYLLSILIMLIGSQALAQSAGNVLYNHPYSNHHERIDNQVSFKPNYGNTAELQAEVMINVEATSFTAIFSATQNGKTATQTDSLLTLRLNQVQGKLDKLGIKRSDVHIDVISMVPSYAMQLEKKRFSTTANEIPTGFKLIKNIHILFFDHEQLSDIVAAMSQSEIYDFVKVEYNVDNIKDIYAQLREEAVGIINQKKKTYNDIGLHLEIQNMTDGYGSSYPIQRYSRYTAYHAGSTVEEVKLAKRRKQQAKNVIVTGKRSEGKHPYE